ncbi:uncharacterized protein LOC135482467 isoform X2 [Lineus longissimus]|uniref:uncharacterized protein LOC135482467 isoform X2 n=1 Tax=Lineus longissimus TaxID=88925 RepID=UPI00315D80C8
MICSLPEAAGIREPESFHFTINATMDDPKVIQKLRRMSSSETNLVIKKKTKSCFRPHLSLNLSSISSPRLFRSLSMRATGSFSRNQSRGKLEIQSQDGHSVTDKDSDSPETRTAKTAPSTPEAEVKSILKNESKTSLMSQLEMSVSSNKTNKTPSPEMPRQRHQSDSPVLIPSKIRNNDKFHKVFKSVAEEEELIKQFSCAFVSDILLQGTLYITENLFCFHSKIVGKRKLIEIPVEKVVAITREKTAFIIPNAIGVVTDTDKYVFGSLISRDNTYRLMYSTWIKNAGGAGLPIKEDIIDLDIGAPEIESYSSPENNNFLDVQRTDSGTGIDLESTTDSDLGSCASCCSTNLEVDSKQSDLFQPIPVRKPSQKKLRESVASVKNNQEMTYFRMLLPYLLLCFDYEGNYKAICQFLTKLRRTARMNLLLAGCFVLVAFFILSATVLAYKVTLLQAHIEGQNSWSESKYSMRSHVYKNLYSLHNDYQAATIEKLHAILRANINILEDVYMSLRTLQESQRAGMKFCQQSSQNNAGNTKTKDFKSHTEAIKPDS